MRIIEKIVRSLLVVSLSMSLGGAAIARVSHEVKAPAKIYAAAENDTSILRLCDANQIQDHKGSPVKLVHIHACGACVTASVTIPSFDPISPLAFVLAPQKWTAYFPEPIVDWASVPPAAPPYSHAPPSFS